MEYDENETCDNCCCEDYEEKMYVLEDKIMDLKDEIQFIQKENEELKDSYNKCFRFIIEETEIMRTPSDCILFSAIQELVKKYNDLKKNKKS